MKFEKYINENIKPDIFYNIDHIKDKIRFLKDSVSKSYKVNIDELDCNVSCARKKSKVSINKIFEIIKGNEKLSHPFYNFIIRNPFTDNDKPYIEVGIRITEISNKKDIFLFINIKLDKLDYFVKKYNLRVYK